MLVWGWLSGPASFQLMPPSSSTLGSLSTRLSPRPAPAPLFLSRSAGLPPSQSERVTHAQCRLAVLAGHPWPASVWRPWHLWFSEQSWRPRGTLGPGVLWRFRWQLWNQPSGRPLGPWRQWKAIQPGDQCSGKGTTPSLPPATSLPPLESMCSFESFLIPHSVSPSLQGAVAQPGYGSVQGSNNANEEVRGRVWGRRGVRCVGQDMGRQRGKKDGRGGDLRLEAVWTEKSWAWGQAGNVSRAWGRHAGKESQAWGSMRACLWALTQVSKLTCPFPPQCTNPPPSGSGGSSSNSGVRGQGVLRHPVWLGENGETLPPSDRAGNTPEPGVGGWEWWWAGGGVCVGEILVFLAFWPHSGFPCPSGKQR